MSCFILLRYWLLVFIDGRFMLDIYLRGMVVALLVNVCDDADSGGGVGTWCFNKPILLFCFNNYNNSPQLSLPTAAPPPPPQLSLPTAAPLPPPPPKKKNRVQARRCGCWCWGNTLPGQPCSCPTSSTSQTCTATR